MGPPGAPGDDGTPGSDGIPGRKVTFTHLLHAMVLWLMLVMSCDPGKSRLSWTSRSSRVKWRTWKNWSTRKSGNFTIIITKKSVKLLIKKMIFHSDLCKFNSNDLVACTVCISRDQLAHQEWKVLQEGMELLEQMWVSYVDSRTIKTTGRSAIDSL